MTADILTRIFSEQSHSRLLRTMQ